MDNPFVYDPKHYATNCRDLKVMDNYAEQAAFYLHRRTGKPFDQCLAFVKRRASPEHPKGMTDPDTLVLTRQANGDRVKETPKLSKFLVDVASTNRMMSPTMAVYLPPEEKQSVLADFITQNVESRNVSKDQMFAFRDEGNKPMETFKKNEQKAFKISNNSISGAHGSNGTILYNKSTHSTLTSTCRTATSYGNVNNEKFLYGNRHYWSPEIVKSNIVTIASRLDSAQVEQTMAAFGIVYPDTDQVMAVIRYSTDLYWRNEKQMAEIRLLVDSLTPTEKAAFVYMGDLFHLAHYNEALIHSFVGRLSTKASEPVDDPDYWISEMDADLEAFACLLCADELAGGNIKKLKTNNPQGYGILAATAKNVIALLGEYEALIQTFWRVDVLPPSVAHVRSSIRRGVVTSDTDSSIFTVQDWVRWHTGKLDFSDEATAVGNSMVYLATQTITHILALASGGMGVREHHIHTLSMKNEFYFPVFTLTSMAKHYFAYVSAQEGTVFDEFDTEVKGVNLKITNAPKYISDEFDNSIRWAMDQVYENGQLSIQTLLDKVAGIEMDIMAAVRKGSSEYLSSAQINEASAYTNPESANWLYYDFWESVFADKYGPAPFLPYQAVKVSVSLKNQTQLKAWLAAIEDPVIAEKLKDWLTRRKKTNITTLLLPQPIVDLTGIPEEILKVVDMRKIVYTTTKPFYLLLEALGVYCINDHLTRLVSDRYVPQQAA